MADITVSALRERFSSSELLSIFVIFVPETYHHMRASELEAFGKDEFKKLLKHFCSSGYGAKCLFVVTGKELGIMHEFKVMKEGMHHLVNALNYAGTSSIWRKLSDNGFSLFPNIMKLVQVMFVIPVQTAVVERGFSLHKIIKNRLRNRLQILTVDSLLRVKML
jgi:hypothetical protein